MLLLMQTDGSRGPVLAGHRRLFSPCGLGARLRAGIMSDAERSAHVRLPTCCQLGPARCGASRAGRPHRYRCADAGSGPGGRLRRPGASARHVGTTAARPCGTARTAANVPVRIRVERGAVNCRTALQIERAYAAEIREGKAPGNGGGGPVKVQGWTCEGFPTPQVLATGQASRCVRGRDEILAILPSPA